NLARTVEPDQPDALRTLERGLQAGEPARLAHLDVVVKEAERLSSAEPRTLIERADEPHVRIVPMVGQRMRAGALAEERRRLVGGPVVYDAQLERRGGRLQAIEARSGQRELVEDHQHDGRASSLCHASL